MLHNSDPFGSSEAPLNMGASVNMTINGPMNVPNGFNMGKSSHEASQSSNSHNIPSYPHYGYPVMSPHTPMHHFQNFPSNVFPSSFMGHNSPALHDTSWQHGMLPMNLNTHTENSSNMNFYDRKEFPYSDYKEQNLHNKSVPLNVPQVYSKAYHKEATVTHPNYQNYQDPGNLRPYDKSYLDNNLDLTMNKTQKPETRSYDLDLSTKPPALDESRRRSLENTVKMIENILIHNPTSSSSSNYPMPQTKHSQMSATITNYNKNIYDDKGEDKNTYNERSGNKNMYKERSDYNSLSNEQLENKNVYNETPDPKTMFPDRSDSKNIYSDKCTTKNIYNDRSENKNVYSDTETTTTMFNEKSATNIFNERANTKPLYNERPETKNIFNEGSFSKNDSGDFQDLSKVTSENKKCNVTSTKKDVYEKRSENKNMYNDMSEPKNIHNENKTPEKPKTNHDKEIAIAEASKSAESTNLKSKYSCKTENSVESEINSDVRNNNLTNSPENENNDSVIEENNENQIERIEIKIELQSNDSDSESEDVKPLSNYVLKNPLEELTEMSQTSNGIEVKVEELSSWADSEQCNPFQRDVFGVTKECTVGGVLVKAESSIDAAKEAIAKVPDPPEKQFFECSSCSLYFSNPKKFLIHNKWHGLKLPIEKRTEMEMARLMKRNMRKEARKLWKMNSEEIKDGSEVTGEVFKCNSCEKMFSTRGSLKNHKQRFHPTLVRECLICHKTLVGWQAIKTHRATEHTSLSDSRYQCTDCPKRFKFSHSLVKHLDTHLEKTHPCDLCPKKFGSQKLLNTHMKTHERVMRGMTCHCSYCGKGFFESYQLQVHERTHRNERPFLCEICNTSFGTNSSLQRHLKVSHSSSKPWQCSTCRRNFVSEKIRDRHVLRHHGDAESFKFLCGQCPCRYLNQKDLNKHVQKNHPRPGRKKRTRKSNDSE